VAEIKSVCLREKTRLMTMATVNFGRWQTSCSMVIKGSTQNVAPWPIKQLRSEPDHYREFEIEKGRGIVSMNREMTICFIALMNREMTSCFIALVNREMTS
jgi:hypothetical protein